jgi:CYTH domain-containing protein
MTFEDDREDLARHEREIAAHESFNYALFDEHETALLGCVYIDPSELDGVDADVSWWVVDELAGGDVDAVLESSVRQWMSWRWPFRRVRYSVEDVPRTSRVPGEGRYARVERERRWVVAGVPEDADDPRRVEDLYVVGTTLRLRRVSGSAEPATFKLTQKVRVRPTDPFEVKLTNVYLTAAEHERLASRLPARKVVKTRWSWRQGGVAYAIDVFESDLDGLVLAEAELHRTQGSPIDPPPAVVADVTHDDRFCGAALAHTSHDDLATLLDDVRHA